jgi:alpha-L-fucosidase
MMLCGLPASGEEALRPETLPAYRQRMEWFASAQYGMFIHFGLYSVLGGEWENNPVGWYSEWIQASANIPREKYARIAEEFNPVDFDADFIVRTAKASGMTYLVITSKHHEGFCLWDSAFTDFDVGSTPFRNRDILEELSRACQKYGLKFGLYYSIIDWNHPTQEPGMDGRTPFSKWGQTRMLEGKKADYLAYQQNQLLELIERYDPDLVWFDGDWVKWWTLDDGINLYNTLLEAKPDLVVNNRVAKRDVFQLDYVTQEQKHFDEAFGGHWEGCYTMNKSWGYKAHDDNWKNPRTIYNKLKDINGKGGNLLLNVGPDGRGRIQPEALTILKETEELCREAPFEKQQPVLKEVPNRTYTNP